MVVYKGMDEEVLMRELTDQMLGDYTKEELITLKDNIANYIVNFNNEDIKWQIMNAIEIERFMYDNYYKDGKFVSWNDLDINLPLGMFYLFFPPYAANFNFFIGTIKNKLNKETILGCIIYDEHFNPIGYNELFTCILTVEINYFYQGLGLLNVMFDNFCKVINKEQRIIMTIESMMGKRCQVMNHLKLNLNNYNFKKGTYFEYELEDKYFKISDRKI